jgi:glycosyltransferase involved in cell wall biosynthesis
MTVRHFAPRPPAASGVVDYAESLHRALAPHGDIRWDPGPGLPLYHLGNNGLHAEIYRQALREPGVVILHDAVLQHLMLGTLTESEYVKEFVYNYGPWSAELGRRLFRHRARSAGDAVYFDYPMIRRLAERSLAVVVHNARAAAIVARHAPAARVEIIPHLVEPREPPPSPPKRRAVFGVFGHLRESKRLRSFLEAARIARVNAVVAGRFVSETYERSLAPLLSAASRIPFGSRAEFIDALASVDAVVNLRSPSAGETSGVTVEAMSLARPVIVSAHGEALDYPAGLCAAVDKGPREVETLAAMMAWLAGSPQDRCAMGAAARRYVADRHAPARVAALFQELFARVVI